MNLEICIIVRGTCIGVLASEYRNNTKKLTNTASLCKSTKHRGWIMSKGHCKLKNTSTDLPDCRISLWCCRKSIFRDRYLVYYTRTDQCKVPASSWATGELIHSDSRLTDLDVIRIILQDIYGLWLPDNCFQRSMKLWEAINCLGPNYPALRLLSIALV